VKNNLGYTIIELLVVISVIGLFTGLTMNSYVQRERKETLKAITNEIRSVIELARSKSVNSEMPNGCTYINFDGYGVETLVNSISLNYICSETITLVQNINLTKYSKTAISINDFYFEKTTGELFRQLSDPDSEVIEIKHTILNSCNTIEVNKFGVITVNEDTACSI
jgi:prepilin-type N-terminal cleavage/methylation domain-containing protein